MSYQFFSQVRVSLIWSALKPLLGVLCLVSLGATATTQDFDADSIPDSADNCYLAPNTNQRDTDGDGIGNACDSDLNQDCTVNFIDIAQFSTVFLSSDPDADFNGDGSVSFLDFVLLANAFLTAPGPSGIANLCGPGDTLSLLGTTGPVAIDGGAVSVVVDQTAAGGGVVVYNGTTSFDGSFQIDITGANDSDFVTIAIVGLGGQAGIALTSLAGSIEDLAAAGDNDGTVEGIDAAALNLSPLTTAFSVLASEAQGSDINSASELLSIETKVDGAQLLDLASSLTAVIANPAVSLPSGSSDTLSFAANTEVRQDFLVRLKTEQLADYDAAVSGTLAFAGPSFQGESPSGLFYTTFINNVFSIAAVEEFEFIPGNLVVYRGGATGSGSSTITAEGAIAIDFVPPLQTGLADVLIIDPDGSGKLVQTPQASFLEQVQILRVRDGVTADHVVISRSAYINFPDYPALGDTDVSTAPQVPGSRILLDDTATLPFSPLELDDTGIAINYYHQNNESEGSSDRMRGFDTLDFQVGGTGTTRRRGFAFNWQILANGELRVDFANGDVARYRRLIDGEDQTHIGNLYYQLAGSGEKLERTFFVPRDESAAYDNAALINRSYRSALSRTETLNLPFLRVFDFVFSDAGAACRNPDSPSSTWTWSLVDGRMELYRDLGVGGGFFSRTWQPIKIVGNRYWMVETLQTEFNGLPVVDASMTPGRVNRYTFEHDSSVDTRPVLNDDFYSTSVDTPLIIYLADILSNDVDAEGDEIIFRSFSGGGAGGFIENQDFDNTYPYAFLYTPPPGFVGVETFVFEASDIACRGELPLPSSTLFITVN